MRRRAAGAVCGAQQGDVHLDVVADVVSARHFDRWWKQARRTQPDLLTFTTAMLTSELAPDVSTLDYPDTWQQGELALPLSYRFEPGAPDDGVTVLQQLGLIKPA